MNNAKHIPGGNEPKEPRRSLMQIDAERLRVQRFPIKWLIRAVVKEQQDGG